MNADRLAYVFGVGMAAAINPCGFALLPAYLAYYLGLTDDSAVGGSGSREPVALRATKVALAMTSGFLVVFGVVGLAWSSISSIIGSRLPWVTAILGLALVVLGVAMMFGFEPTVAMPKPAHGKGDPTFRSMFVFGVSYAVASLSCTIGLFISVVGLSNRNSFAESLSAFVAYALGMGTLVALLTVAVAMARTGLIATFRRIMPYMGRISGAMVAVAGAIVAYYGWSETRTESTGFARWLVDRQSGLLTWIRSVGEVRVGIIAVFIISSAIAISLLIKRSPPPQPDGT